MSQWRIQYEAKGPG
ncbi:unnamed protein product, partial [Rotaria sp. Silwood1]